MSRAFWFVIGAAVIFNTFFLMAQFIYFVIKAREDDNHPLN